MYDGGDVTPPAFPETMRVAVLSTAHLTHLDHDILESIHDGLRDPDDPIYMLDDTDGVYWIYCAFGPEAEIPNIRGFGFSPAFDNILRKAWHEGFTYVRFDSDGPIAATFPTFEWAAPRQGVINALAAVFGDYVAVLGDTSVRSGATLMAFRDLALSTRATQDEIVAASSQAGSALLLRHTYQYQVARGSSNADEVLCWSIRRGHFADPRAGHPAWCRAHLIPRHGLHRHLSAELVCT